MASVTMASARAETDATEFMTLAKGGEPLASKLSPPPPLIPTPTLADRFDLPPPPPPLSTTPGSDADRWFLEALPPFVPPPPPPELLAAPAPPPPPALTEIPWVIPAQRKDHTVRRITAMPHNTTAYTAYTSSSMAMYHGRSPPFGPRGSRPSVSSARVARASAASTRSAATPTPPASRSSRPSFWASAYVDVSSRSTSTAAVTCCRPDVARLSAPFLEPDLGPGPPKPRIEPAVVLVRLATPPLPPPLPLPPPVASSPKRSRSTSTATPKSTRWRETSCCSAVMGIVSTGFPHHRASCTTPSVAVVMSAATLELPSTANRSADDVSGGNASKRS
mmetsp:Transcript_36745/g.98580  ORF Transcript_36745/g.98580 Transcript_36745/m.98580 type:complete len:335 (-) Transcript_36745:289-1293(-)